MPVHYLEKVIQKYKTGKTTEHSFRGDLQNFVEHLIKDIEVINEPTRQKCGAPDYIIQKKNIPLGYIEAKDIDKDLDKIENDEQLTRYKKSLDNLILTNYLEFRFYHYGEKVKTIKIGEIEKGKIKTYPQEFDNFVNHIKDFCNFKGQTIKSAKQLANMMAQKAVLMKDVLEKAVQQEGSNSLKNQMNAFKTILLHDLDEHTFADMYAQTIAYGLFVARLNDKSLEDFSRQEARELVSKTNPFLRQLFDYISGANLDERVVWIVEDLVEIFRATDLNKLLRNFGQSTMQKDPFLHFYETFLEDYDKANKEKRGVYYTPQPVVKFIVRAVDDILKQDFNLQHGLADTTKIKYKRKAEQTNKIVEENIYKVQILDPATGTGTFLAETITKIYEKFVNQKGLWNQYVDEALIPRLHGFEILMTPYVMCHLKLDLLLQETGYTHTSETNRFNVYLTNALEKDDNQQYPLFDWLAEEARRAKTIKNETPIMVVLGNPPYSVSSCNKNDYIDGLISEYKKDLNERKINLDDDYIKFIRMGESYIEKNGEGILAYISNNSFIDGITHRQMRKHLLETFDKIYIIDLHGSAKKNETCPDGSKDENVFNIQQGVSINIFIKTGQKKKNQLAKVFHKDLCGIKQLKYGYLDTNSLKTVDFNELQFETPYYFFVPKDFSLNKDYNSGFPIKELFLQFASGIQTKRDNVAIAFNSTEINQTIESFKTLEIEELRQKYSLPPDGRDWTIANAKNDLLAKRYKVAKNLYRPFDLRFSVFSQKCKGFVAYPRTELMKNLVEKENLALITCRQQSTFDFQHTFITKYMSDMCNISSQTKETGYVFPLYLYLDDEQQSFFEQVRTPNLDMKIVKELEKKLKLAFTPEKEETSKTFAPIDILDYIYGILHSKKYREKFKEFLKIDFPKIPYPENAQYFFEVGALGKQIRELHLLESPKVENYIT